MNTIKDGVFAFCTSLASINFPEGLTSIGNRAFYCCAFTSITLPEGITSIGDNAFSNSNSLESITFPSTIESIGNEVLIYCWNLDGIYIKAITPPSIGSSFYSTVQNIYVPSASVDAYQAAWTDYASKITGYTF